MKKESVDEWKDAVSSDVIKLEEGERIEGELIALEESKKFPQSYALTIKSNGENKVIFVNEIVKDMIEKNNIMKNQEIALLFVGKVKNQKGDREYNDFKLFFK